MTIGLLVFALYYARTDAFLPVSQNAVHMSRLLGASEDPSGIFRPINGSYVPSGLTAEQYQQLKQKEAEKVRKMDFGAWGPRFKRSNRPDGDWLLQSNLWSSGFSIDDDKSNQHLTTPNPAIRKIQRLQTFLARNAQPFALLVVWFHVLFSAIRVARSASSFRTSALALFTFRQIQTACVLGLSVILPPLAARWLEWSSRHRLWTTRRMTIVSASLSLLAFGVWMAIVVDIRVLFVKGSL